MATIREILRECPNRKFSFETKNVWVIILELILVGSMWEKILPDLDTPKVEIILKSIFGK